MKKYIEIRFEETIELSLIESGGYSKGNSAEFDAKRALFPKDITEFISNSQPVSWKHVLDFNGDASKENMINALQAELSSKGSLFVLRNGFRFFGRTFKLAYFKPNTTLNPTAKEDYEKNILKVYRQVHHSEAHPTHSLDMVIALNGIPVATLELKNPLSGQTVENAKWQYKKDRDPRELIFQFKKRALVHFAVDTDEVYMTTKLAGDDTFFLPFNKGFNLGAGNPPQEDNYRTAYLWEEVLVKDSLLDIIGRYLHLEVSETKVYTDKGVVKKEKETMIFPRFHQLDVVRKLIINAKVSGSGHNYLVQHSAGSGKSNSIAWLAYRLASLHNEIDEKIFHSVIVITDRRVLDKQLQDTIYQFDHTEGVVKKIDENTKQLVEALATGVPIIVTTLQKFPFVIESVEKINEERKEKKKQGEISLDTQNKRFAVIVDEAHSSQSGEAAAELKKILNKDGIEKAVLEQMISGEDDTGLSKESREQLMREMAKRPQQPNISFFAFTATPKFRTKVVFNEPGSNGESPFHLYSMRQAIEEGFILDVLENYTTYKRYFKLVKSIEDDPKVPRRKSSIALARFINLHPHNLRQKVEVIIEHFRASTRYKIGGRGKAMVVTSSRMHAVRYKQEIDKYIQEKEYTNLKSLVAFSGKVVDDKDDSITYRESIMNGGIRESELPDKFESYEYQVLIVAEKYQTGFDQPLLHTMYVDKRLAGIQAVQTLSRLNRTAAGKVDTFVLDFVNDREEIFEAFKPYYERTIFDVETDPQLLYQLEHTLLEWRVFNSTDIKAYCEIWFSTKPDLRTSEHKKLNALLDPAVENYNRLTEEEKVTCKKQMFEFRNLYSFLSQVIPFSDSDSEMMFVYIRNLLRKLPKRGTGNVDFGEEIALKYYRLQKISEGRISLTYGEPPIIYGPKEVGTGSVDEDVRLSTIIEKLNEAFGTQFTFADQLFFDQVKETAVTNVELTEAAKVNSLENFSLVFEKMLERLFVDRMEGNEEIFVRLMNDNEFRNIASKHLVRDVYSSILDRMVKEE
jgi:type I restriction enzyme, R subunit